MNDYESKKIREFCSDPASIFASRIVRLAYDHYTHKGILLAKGNLVEESRIVVNDSSAMRDLRLPSRFLSEITEYSLCPTELKPIIDMADAMAGKLIAQVDEVVDKAGNTTMLAFAPPELDGAGEFVSVACFGGICVRVMRWYKLTTKKFALAAAVVVGVYPTNEDMT